MRLVPGDPERLGGYWLAGRLGAGGQGVVYDAYDAEGRRFAVKVLHGGLSGQLAKEAAAAGRVASFCTARVVEARLDAERPYIVSEFVEGPNLRQALERHGPYSGDSLLRLAVALATALAAVHSSGVVHRDLKPENVLLGPDGPRVIDFGVARTTDGASTSFIGGTPTYMAPEVFTGRRAGPPADVFAWGGVVLFAATGEDPFQAESLGGVMHRVLTVDPDPGDLAEPLRSLVARALAKDPAGRPTAPELLLGLLGSAEPSAGAELAAEVRPPDGLGGERPLGEVAEEVYAALTPEQQRAVPGLLLRMLDGETLRRIPRDEAEDLGVLTHFAEAGLLVRRSLKVAPEDTETGKLVAVSDDLVAPASAALYHAWPRLRSWVADDRDGLAVHGRLRGAALHWQAHRRRAADLYHGSALDTALGWAATTRRHLDLNALERDFLDRSAAQARRRGRRRGLALAAMAALLAVAVSASVLAVRQSQDLSKQLAQANARAVAARAEAMRATDPQAAMRLSVAAWSLSPVFEARTALQHSLAQPEVSVFTDPEIVPSAAYHLAFDGKSLLKRAGDQVVTWDIATGRATGRARVPGGQVEAISDDGARAAVSDGSTVRTVELATGKQVGAARPQGDAVELLAEGRLLALSAGGRTELYPADGAPLPLDLTGRTYAVSRDGRWAALGSADDGGRAELWDLRSRKRTTTVQVDVPVAKSGAELPLAFSPDGSRLAVTGATGITLVDTATGGRRLLPSRGGSLLPAVFSPDGRFLAERLEDQAQLWRVADAGILGQYPVRQAEAALAFSGDGRALRYVKGSGSVVSIDVSSAVELTPDEEAVSMGMARLSPGGRVTALQVSGAIKLTDALKKQPIGRIEGTGDLAFDDGGTLLAVAADPVVIWDVAAGRRVNAIDTGHEPSAVRLSPDGGTLAVVRGPDIDLWSVRDGRKTRTLPGVGSTALAFSPDGKTLASGADLVELSSGRVTRDPAGVRSLAPDAVAFSPDGRTLGYVLGEDGRMLLWDFSTRKGRTAPVSSGALHLRFSPDGRLLAVGGERVEIWEADSLREVGQAPVDAYPADMAFSDDGRRLFVVQPGGEVQQSPIDPLLAAEQVCARAGGALSEAEWAKLIPEASYRSSC
ncbi:protein kinase [Nonomuraea sp. NPDC050547]|uniref:protein kinase domain-containing protein n=1 Tax=Nonomuraea sp. NPDC050547 TaxID=3364368 RepID=UPI0037A604BB